MAATIRLGDIAIDVLKKDIKNVHLSVYPPSGKVRISAPLDMDISTIRVFAISRLGWVKQQQRKLRSQERETRREYIDRESHYVWGRRYLLKVLEVDEAPRVDLKPRRLVLQVRPGSSIESRRALLDSWYRAEIKRTVPSVIKQWQKVVGVQPARFFVQTMKTKWGSCNASARTIRLNTELAKKPRECLEYIVVHEIVHLLEPTHNARFIGLMDRLMPRWEIYRQELNRLPVRHERWDY
ncbi:MAG: M48 family metallopeptidase [Steroidobacter sp.]